MKTLASEAEFRNQNDGLEAEDVAKRPMPKPLLRGRGRGQNFGF